MSKQSSLMSFFTPKGGTPKAAASPRVSESTPVVRKSESTPKSTRAPLKRVNERMKKEDGEGGVLEKEPKRRRVILSSSSSEGESEDEEYDPSKEKNEEEEEDDEDEGMEEEEEETPEKKRKPSSKVKKTPKRKGMDEDEEMEEEEKEGGGDSDGEFAFDSAMATSFIGSFGMKEDDISEKVKELLDAEATVGRESTVEEEEKPKEKKKKGKKDEEEDEKVDEYTHEKLEWLKPDRIRDMSGRRPDDPEYDPTTVKIPDQFFKEQTPGHHQWWTIKSYNFDTVLLFKVGKFYELYHMDATVAVTCLNLAYMKGTFAHCGFPESAFGRFADQLVQRGYKVARIEQTETPDQLAERNKKEKTKSKVVRRELCRVTTVGTRTYDAMDSPLDGGKTEEGETQSVGETATAYLLAIKEIVRSGGSGGSTVTTFGIAFIDTSIGRFFVGSFDDDCYFSHLRTLIARHPPAQVLMERNKMSPSTRSLLSSMLPSSVPIESLTPKKEFLEPEKTITMLLSPSRLGGSVSSWPPTLVSMLSPDESLPTAANKYKEAWSALGALLSFLGRCLIDIDMVTMKQFERFDPTAAPIESSLSTSSSSSSSWSGRRMVIDGVGLEQLSLVPLDYASEQTSGSLYAILNRCKTPFGARLLRSWVCAPSCDKEVIEERQKAVQWLITAEGKRCQSKVEELMDNLPDLERLLQKIHSIGLVHRAREHPDSRAIMFETEKYDRKRIRDLIGALDGFKLCEQIGELCDEFRGDKKNDGSLLSAAPFNVKKHLDHFKCAFDASDAQKTGKIIPNEGADEEFDAARARVEGIKKRLDEYCIETGRKYQCKASLVNCGKDRNLIELPEKTKVSSDFEKKTMKKGFVRYTNPSLLSLNCELSEAESDVECLLKDATRRVFADFDQRKSAWQATLDAVSTLDVLISLSKYSESTGVPMCIPQFVYGEDKPVLEVVEGYHPCIVVTGLASIMDDGVETTSSTTFIPNNVTLGGGSPSTLLLTGPNMGGKSTLMRQVAVLTILAHMGSLVPAKSMRLSPVDRIFTRLGASDRLVAGQSTFFVEMNESAIALRDATKHSLAIFDELGRGTGTLDGQSLAWAIMQQMTKRIGARSVFSTHYHGLCESLQNDKEVLQMHMGCVVEEEEESTEVTNEAVTFLYRLIPGVCPRSFGFNAARLAGIEDHVIRNSWQAAKKTFGDGKGLKKLREAAERDESVEELRRLVQAAF